MTGRADVGQEAGRGSAPKFRVHMVDADGDHRTYVVRAWSPREAEQKAMGDNPGWQVSQIRPERADHRP